MGNSDSSTTPEEKGPAESKCPGPDIDPIGNFSDKKKGQKLRPLKFRKNSETDLDLTTIRRRDNAKKRSNSAPLKKDYMKLSEYKNSFMVNFCFG
jgi:hypothetical protein